jgi:REP element-mobilizing transposase RayT
MGYALREIDPELVYHVTCRGNNQGQIAWDRHDYESLAGELARVAERYRWDVLSWCFLTNHYHLLLRTPFGGFSDGFQVMNANHARRTNRRHDRRDHLFRHRPRAFEIKSEAHLVASILYVARNPLAAGLCENLSAWPYASYRAIAGLEKPPAWLALEAVDVFFGATRAAACSEFTQLVHDGHLLVSKTDEEPPALTSG